MIPDEELRAAHFAAGLWLERAGEVDPVLLGTHFERGGDPGRAAHHFLHAASAAHVRAVGYANKPWKLSALAEAGAAAIITEMGNLALTLEP